MAKLRNTNAHLRHAVVHGADEVAQRVGQSAAQGRALPHRGLHQEPGHVSRVVLCKRLIGEVVQSLRRPLLGPSPC